CLKKGERLSEPVPFLRRQDRDVEGEILSFIQDLVVGGAQGRRGRGARGRAELVEALLGGGLAVEAAAEEGAHDLLGPLPIQTTPQHFLDLFRREVLAHAGLLCSSIKAKL